MATSKKPETKKTAAKKPVPKAVQPEAQTPKPVEEFVDFIIPIDPSLEARCQIFECCLNGKVYCHPRGVMLHLPRYHYDFVSALLRENEHISPEVAEYTNASRRLNF